MGHQPTIFYILENETLGTSWIGRMESTLDGYGMPPYRSITQDQLNDKLSEKYHNPNAYLTLVTLNKRWSACYGVERWLSKLEYKINKEPEKYRELEKLLKAGWDDDIETSTLSVLHVLEHNQPIGKIFKKLVTSREGLTRCLNTYTGKTRAEKYQESKKDPDFMYKRARKEVLRNMEKTGKLPKPETLEKYDIKEDELREIMGPRGIIYKITSPSGKVYVGQTMRSFEERIRNHQRKGSECPAISRAIQKYGDGMKYEIIEENVPKEQLDEREIYWINHFNSLAPNGYNLTTGGQFYQVTQEVKDKMRDTRNTLNIENNGYLGSISKLGNLFYPRVKRDGKLIIVAHGGFQTEEEAIEVLKEYTKDPDNFTVVDNRTRRRDGTITKNGDYWRVVYKSIYLGKYDTEEEAHDVVEKYLKDPENFVKPKRKVGCISLQDNKWRLQYKRGNNLGNYDTKEQAQEALERYLKDPENFTKPEKKIGCVFKYGNRWVTTYKGNRLGSYATKEEAEETRQALQSS
jgi:group I intron endonuclease